jgi:hypothetical protein
VVELLTGKGLKTIPHSPFLPDLAPADFFLISRVKSELADMMLTQGTFNSSWEGVISTTTKEDFAVASQRWMECLDKRVRVGGNHVVK